MPRFMVVRRFPLLAMGFLLASCGELGPDDRVFRIKVLPASDTLAPGSAVQLTAELSNEDGKALTGRTVTWLSSNPTVAQVSASGLVTAVSVGTVTIEAKSEEQRNTSFIIVREPVTAIRLVPNVATMDIHDGFFRPRVELDDRLGNAISDRLVSWRTTNPAVVSVNAFGEIAPIVEGDAQVIANSEGYEAALQVQVRRLAVAALSIEPATPLVFKGLPVQLRALPLRADGPVLFGRSVTWSTSSPTVVSVDATGRLTGLTAGSATVTASSEGANATVSVTVIEGSNGVAVGSQHSCVISAAAAAWCWGNNSFGQLGAAAPDLCGSGWYYYYNDYYPCSRAPIRVETSESFRETSAGESHTCALTLAGKAWCWGNNIHGQLGVGSSFGSVTQPATVQTSVTFKTITTGVNITCGIDTGDEAYCWGYGPDGQLGVGPISVQPARVPGGNRYVSLSAGGRHTCGVAVDGSVWCWGANWAGQLGNGTLQASITPVRVAGNLAAVRVSAGAEHTCAVTTTNAIFCWGANTNGQLGTNTQQQVRSEPTAVAGTTQWKDVTVGGYSSCAIDQAARLFCWGSNSGGQLGHGGFGTGSTVPAPVMTSQLFVSVSLGLQHACGRMKDGGVSCWGNNFSGELGTGTTSQTATPARVTIPQ